MLGYGFRSVVVLEAMRLGCEATAVDINPVAWFILKCTLEYPQRLAGQTRRLPDFALYDADFLEEFLIKGKGFTKVEARKVLKKLGHKARHGQEEGLFDRHTDDTFDADLAWHVRAWGRWVLGRARRELARFYPIYADFEPLRKGERAYETQPMRLVPLKDDGTPDIDSLNVEFSEEYLKDKRNPRWVVKPTVAYLWARTVKCKNCRATVPLLKTRWLCKKANKRVLLTMESKADKTVVTFGVESDVPVRGGNAAQRREHDKRIGAGTMSRAGVKCPCCDAIMTMEDIRVEGQGHRWGATMTAVVVDGTLGQEYRLPSDSERQAANDASGEIDRAFCSIPHGQLHEPTPAGGGRGAARAFSIQGYGLMQWSALSTPRQKLCLGTLCGKTRESRVAMAIAYPGDWTEAIGVALAVAMDRIVDRQSVICRWDNGYTKLQGTFTRFALPITWDYCEGNPFSNTTGNYLSCMEWVAEYIEHGMEATAGVPKPTVLKGSAIQQSVNGFDCVVTDPPYYDAIPYSDLMDFFYVWLRRTLAGMGGEFDKSFTEPLSPKWDSQQNDGELIDDETRQSGDAARSKAIYEDGMYRAFQTCHLSLNEAGRLVIVFANKTPNAWETLVSAIIRAGFVVDGSWPIQTEMGNRTRALTSAALASSVWLVCKKRSSTAKPGWDNSVLTGMRKNIVLQLREFWDAGIRGPDFVWAATGPAMEAYSKHPVVKKADSPGEIMTVSEFLTHVRRMVVDFVVGRVLSGDGDVADQAATDKLDEPTSYYLLHRHDFGMEEAPAGTCILYAVSCGLSDNELADTWDLLARVGRTDAATEADEAEEADADSDAEEEQGSGSKLKLKTWAQRKAKSMGYEAPGGKPVPLIDRVHRLMHLWKAQDVHKVDEYLDDNALRRNELFGRLLQSLIELSPHGSDERSLLESLSNHIGAKGAKAGPKQYAMEDDAGRAWAVEAPSQQE